MMSSFRIACATALLVSAFDAIAQRPADDDALIRAGFAPAEASAMPVAPTPRARFSLRWSPCGDERCYYDGSNVQLFSVKYIHGQNDAAARFPKIAERQDAYARWAAAQDRLIAFGSFRGMHAREIEWKRPSVGIIPDAAGRGGELTTRTLAIPLFASRWRLLSLWRQLQKDVSYVPEPDRALALYVEQRNLWAVVNDASHEERARALLSALTAQNDYSNLLSRLYSGYGRWDGAAGSVDADHLEPGDVAPDVLTGLAEDAKLIDRLLDEAESEETKIHRAWNTPVARQPLPLSLTAAFFDRLDLPAAESEQGRADIVRDTMANKTTTCGQGTCFYGEDGRLHHWANGRSRWKWDGGKQSEETVYITGYPDIQRRQSEFNEWAKTHRRGYSPLHIPADGSLGTETLRIPFHKAEYELRELWRKFELEARGDAPGAPWPSLDDYAARPGNHPLPNISAGIRAQGVREAWLAAKNYEDKVRALEPLSSHWNGLGLKRDHLEPSQLPPGASTELSRAERRLQAAIDDVRRVEVLSR